MPPILREEPENGDAGLSPHIPLHLLHLRLDHQVNGFVGCDCHIELLFRDSQQFTGRAACQARAEAALDFHFNASLATLNLARAEEVRASPDHSAQVFSMASWKQCHFNERLLDLFIESLALDPTWVKNQPCYDELRTYGAIAA